MRIYLLAWTLAFAGCTVPGPGGPAAPAAPAQLAAVTPPLPASPASAAASPVRYRCEQSIDFTVRFMDDAAVIDAGPRGTETLLRDAGGATPHQTVYSSTRMRVEFGLGVTGREAILRYALPPLVAYCVRD